MRMLEFIKNIFVSYLILTFLLTVFNIIRMYVIRAKVGAKEFGLSRLKTLQNQGRYKCIRLYSDEEISKNKKKKVVKLHYFPSDNKKSKRTIIVCPGGGYAHLVIKVEGYPIAAKFNEMGYDAFVLEYRTGWYCSSHAPQRDLARTVTYISQKSGEYDVDPNDYIICGFSAGGNLAATFATKEYGYKKYGLPKPAGIILGYPWTNINHWIEHPYWNIWVGLLGIYLSERGNIHMFGILGHFNREKRDSVCVQNWIDEDYTDVYMFACSKDVLVPCGAHTDVLEKALEDNNVRSKYEKFLALPHGIGLGVGSRAEIWPKNAMEFFEKN